MARQGYIYLGNPVDGDPDSFRNFLAANLTSWVVSTVKVFDTATNERNYWTLTSGTSSAEILVYMPKGSDADLDAGTPNASYYVLTNASVTSDLSLSLSCAVDGGFNTSFGSGFDPDEVGFWPTVHTEMVNMDYWFESNNRQMVIYVIEDDEKDFLSFHVGYATSNAGYSVWCFTEDLFTFDVIPNDPTVNWRGEGVFFLEVTSSTGSTPPLKDVFFTWYHRVGQTERSLLNPTSELQDDLQDLGNAVLPLNITGGLITPRQASFFAGTTDYSYLGFVGQYNPEVLRSFAGPTNTYRSKVLLASGSVLVHHTRYVLMPWANNLPNPL
jgi:hypothetical protein